MKIDIAEARKAIFGGKYDMVILDEIINVMDQGFSGKKEFLNFISMLTSLMMT